MFLKVKGIGKIQDSTIEMKGITVIAGENNTGKSTFGKILYCMFNSFCNFDKKVLNERRVGIYNTISQNLNYNEFKSIHLSDELIEQILNLKDSFSSDNFREIMLNSSDKIEEYDKNIIENIIQRSIDELNLYINLSDQEIKKNIINRYFRSEFFRQINHINRPDDSGEVLLIIGGKQVKVHLLDNECNEFMDDVGVIHSSIYIDTPFILDDIGIRRRGEYYTNYKASWENHKSNLFYRMTKESETAVIKEAIVKQKLDNVLRVINSVANGNFIRAGNSLTFLDNSMQQPVALQNLSTGMKLFLIVKRLLEQGEIKEKDVLIFDEPEIHLHPDWQIKFAEILILLQKEFNLTILLTTHSPYFLHAIEIFSKKHDVQKDCKFYLAKSNGDISDVDDVTDCIDEVYQQMALPFQKLEDVAYTDE